MKSDRSVSNVAARVLAREAQPGGDVAPETRARTIDAMKRAMRAKKHHRRLRWAAFGSVAVAASIALAVGFGRTGNSPQAQEVRPAASAVYVKGTSFVERSGARAALEDGAPLGSGDRIVIDSGARATIALARGTYLTAEDRAEIVIESLAPRSAFLLTEGAVRADVAKLAAGERFVIRTPDAEVEVHGTSFEVSRAASDRTCGDGTTTRVRVFEGIVSVRANGVETLVHPSEVWPVGCGKVPPPAVVATNAVAPSVAPQVDGRPPTSAAPARKPSASSSDLAMQNDLFDQALARKRASDPKGAVALLDDLLLRYPASHLAQSARVERMKLLRGVDGEKARAAARDYLKHHPSGFARADAELILGD